MTVATTTPAASAAAIARRSRWIPWVFAGGMMVVVAVNAVLITTALTSFPGLVVQRPYDRGIAYNDELRQSRAQAALGWQVSPRYESGRLVVGIADASGAFLPGLDVRATMSRPLGGEVQVDAELRPAAEAYAAAIALPRRGQWDLRLVASGAAGDFRATYRIVVP
jgi:nitrogen fixation protein FixH